MITKGEYFDKLGFIGDPFASTNALYEDMLKDYFVYPDYFYSLLGSFEKPKSSIVLAPRGTGKTAQRKMIEYLSEEKEELISIVYDSFPIGEMNDVKNITFEKHVNKIIEFLLIALLTKLDKENKSNILDENEKKKLIKLINNYISGINSNEIDIAIKSIKGFGDKLYDFWLKAGNSITSIINAILSKKGIGNVAFTSNTKNDKEIQNSKLVNILDFIEKVFNKLGVEAIYVLIDRVDENRLTNNDSNKSYSLIKPIISDLPLLEREKIVFKFFLWDKIQEHWHDDIRTDRIEIYNMKWQLEKIKILISKRLKAFSNGKIKELSQILKVDDYYINKVFQFSNNSPRDLINILRQIFDYHLTVMGDGIEIPNKKSVIKGIDKFCEEKFKELVPKDKQRRELKKIKATTFTIPHLYNNIFKCKSSTARNKLMPWTRSGIVLTADEKIKAGKKGSYVNLYTVKDLRIARNICSNVKLEDFIERNLHICEECGTINVFDLENIYNANRHQCYKCQSELIDDFNTSDNMRLATSESGNQMRLEFSDDSSDN